MKAIAVYTLFIIILIILFTVIAIILFFNWMHITGIEASSAACSIKIYNYCSHYYGKEFKEPPYDWNKVDPQGCEKFLKDIPIPPNEETCRNLLLIKK